MTRPDAMVKTPLMSREPLAIAFRPKRSCSRRMTSEAGNLVTEVMLNMTNGLYPRPSTLREIASKHSVSTILCEYRVFSASHFGLYKCETIPWFGEPV
jgi:hypothetical protein